ncbi:MAG TPA: tryptophan synthase subunit alpha [Myxococcota bacterium]|jgi:tryptophan synthase alpha chain|nr:tryptophan synthase subunit alpha [Myxococcota bacterium]
MGRIAERFRALRARGEKALIPFVTAGDPDLATTEALVVALAEAGADAIEIGVPHSDPIAEGPTIQRSSERALRGGVSLRAILELVERVRPRVDVPLVLMGYANNLLAMGEKAFAERAAAVGVDGLIAVDLPPEEGGALNGFLRARGVDPILLAAPTTRPARLAMLAKETRGFLYFVSLTGVTGARRTLSETLEREVGAVRELSDVPVCVGFGVATPEHARDVARFADGVVVGSALVDRIAGAASPEKAVEAAARFAAELKAPLRGSG